MCAVNAAGIDHKSGGNDGTGDAKLAAPEDSALSERVFDRAHSGLDGGSEIALGVGQGIEGLALTCEQNLAFIQVECGGLVVTLRSHLTACK